MFARDIGIDLGTASVLVYIKDKGIVLREPSVVALDKNTGKLLKVGTEAQQMLGKTPGNIVAIRPLREGVISDYDMTERMLREFIRKVAPVRVFKPRVVICVPSGITEVEERAVVDAGIQAGARRAYLIEEPVAAAIGAGIDIPYSGFELPLALLTFPLAFLFVLMFGYKYVKKMDFAVVQSKLNNEPRQKFGFRVYIPLILAIVMMVLNKLVPAFSLGMPLIFLIAAAVGCFTGYKFNVLNMAKESVNSVLPVMGILMGVGMFIQIMTLTGVRGFIVSVCLGLPEQLLYLAAAISIPLFGAVSSFGAASVLGVPFTLAFLNGNTIVTIAGLSLIASLGDMMPPTALAGIFAAKVTPGVDSYTSVLKRCAIPMAAVMVWGLIFVIFSSRIAGLIG